MNTSNSCGTPIILSLYWRPSTHKHCFIAMNSEPNNEDSTHICFLLHQYTNTLLIYTRNPVLKILVTISEAWSALTFTQMMNSIPLGSHMFGGSSSFPSTWPSSLDAHSHLSNFSMSTTGLLGSYTNLVL